MELTESANLKATIPGTDLRRLAEADVLRLAWEGEQAASAWVKMADIDTETMMARLGAAMAIRAAIRKTQIFRGHPVRGLPPG